ncbi:hypothetical protein J6590_065688 [Homalodisca vitripennis]|nr:hypothetical protein J6590_065688 [Homalodisca vitripennis]
MHVYLSLIVSNVDVIVLTECWLKEGEEGVNVEGFDLILSDLVDVFVRYNDMQSVQATVLHTAVTDHYSTGLRITVHATATDTPLAPITYTDEKLFTECLITSNWDPVLNCYDVNECSANFSGATTESLSIAKKEIKHPTTRKKKLKPWISNDLVNLIPVGKTLADEIDSGGIQWYVTLING